MNAKKHWYAVYTHPRWEKKVHKLLTEAGIESYCPLNTTIRKWSDRLKKVEEPLFKSYVFVHLLTSELQAVRNTPGVVNFVYWLHKPAIIRDQEIEDIKRFLGEYDQVEVIRMDGPIRPGNRLRITSGLLMEKEATAIKVHGRTVEVLIESIGFKLVATIDKKRLEKV